MRVLVCVTVGKEVQSIVSARGPGSLKVGSKVMKEDGVRVGLEVGYFKRKEVWVISNLRLLQMLQPALSEYTCQVSGAGSCA
jgi:hypothetical protein